MKKVFMRRNRFWVLILLLSISWLYFSCSDTTSTSSDVAVVTGMVYHFDNNNELAPLANALISASDYYAQAHSNQSGAYRLEVELDNTVEEADLTIQVTKAGYESDYANMVIRKGETTTAPDITMMKSVQDTTQQDTTGQDTTGISGKAAHIEISGSHSQHIYVLGSGLQESAKITFVVRDAQGTPVDENHRVLLHFSVLNGPMGGEYLDPDTMTTVNGYAFTSLNSGIKAGPVQLQAFADVEGNRIWTIPVRMAIFGGLPDPNHFSLAADISNIAGLIHSGLIDKITAFVGDKYSNPVAPGTIVYFSSDYGIVDGSAATDEMGRATAQFMTASPRPPAPWDSAFVHITGKTYRDTMSESLISSAARVLLTDNTAPIQVDPSTFTYNDTNTPVSFNYVVSDVWGRPLVGDSKIVVTATDGSVFGDADVTLQDTQASGPGFTNFSFTWAPGDSLQAPQVYVNIKVTTPSDGNGYKSVHVLGTKVK